MEYYNDGNDWSASNYGYVTFSDKTHTNNKIEFSAVGNRGVNGVLYYSGTFGRYWSSTQLNSTDGYYMRFVNSKVDPFVSYNKASGYNVRCVRNN